MGQAGWSSSPSSSPFSSASPPAPAVPASQNCAVRPSRATKRFMFSGDSSAIPGMVESVSPVRSSPHLLPAQQCWPLFSSGRVTVEGLYPPQSGLKPLPPTPRQSDCLDCGAACKQCSRPLPAGHMWSCHSPNVRTEIQLIRHRPHWAPVCSCAEPDSLVRPGLVQSVHVCFLNKIGTVAVAPVAGQHLCQHCLSHSHRRYALPLRPLRCNYKSVLRNSAIDHSYPKHIIIYSFVTCCKQINVNILQ